MGKTLKYEPLAERLRQEANERVELTFGQVGSLVGGLPVSARRFAQWWENTPHHSQARAWLAAGFRVEGADRSREIVRFVRSGG
jgi:hypothetical protein